MAAPDNSRLHWKVRICSCRRSEGTTLGIQSRHMLITNTDGSPEGRGSGQESQNVEISHVRQQTKTREDTQAVSRRRRNEHGTQTAVSSSGVGTDSKVFILDQRDWDGVDCQDGGLAGFLIFFSFSCRTVSPSRDEISEIRWMKERDAPAIGSR